MRAGLSLSSSPSPNCSAATTLCCLLAWPQISLDELKAYKGSGQPLDSMALFKYGRLSVQPVAAAEWEFVLGLEEQPEAAAADGGAAAVAAAGKKKRK